MNKFQYQVHESVDLSEITKKATSYIVNKRSLTNRYSTFNTFSEYFDAIVSLDNRSSGYNTYRTIFRGVNIPYPDFQPNTVHPIDSNGIFNLNDKFAYPFNINHMHHITNGVCEVKNGKSEYTTSMVNNAYLGLHQGRIYTLITHVVDDSENGIDGYAVVESYPRELLYSIFSKDYFENEYTVFSKLFEQRTITIIPLNGNAFTFYPSNIDCIKSVSPSGFSKTISSQNRKVMASKISQSFRLNIDFESDNFNDGVCSIIHIMKQLVTDNALKALVSNLPFDMDDLDSTLLNTSMSRIFTQYAPLYSEDVRNSLSDMFDESVYDELTLRQLISVISVSQKTNGYNNAFFFPVDDFLGYVNKEYIDTAVTCHKLPLKALINIEGFSDGRLVKMSYDDDNDVMKFELTPHGEHIISEFIDMYSEYYDDEDGNIEQFLKTKLLTPTYYLHEPFLMDVAYPVYIDKENLKTFLKGCHYVKN